MMDMCDSSSILRRWRAQPNTRSRNPDQRGKTRPLDQNYLTATVRSCLSLTVVSTCDILYINAIKRLRADSGWPDRRNVSCEACSMKKLILPDPRRTADAAFYNSLSEEQKLPPYGTNSVAKESREITDDEAEKLYEVTNPNGSQ
jgi:hypothetical protein